MKDFQQEDPENWKWGIVYFNSKDFRFIVPKRNPIMGSTFNFAHPIAYIFLAFIIILIVYQSSFNS